MPISKRTRFEVLRRDNFTCRYCHATDTALTVDHVMPTALGGADAPNNLVAACKDCNAGKAASSPDGALVAQVADDAIRWARARERAVETAAARRKAAAENRQPFLDAWHSWDENGHHLPAGWSDSIDRWLDAGIPCEQIVDALNITLPRRDVHHRDVFRYIGGIVKRALAELDELTTRELSRMDVTA